MKYLIKRDKGEGTPAEGSPSNPYSHLMKAIEDLTIQVAYYCEGTLNYSEMADGRYVITEITETTQDIPPGTIVDGAIVQTGYLKHVHKRIVARLWLEEISNVD